MTVVINGRSKDTAVLLLAAAKELGVHAREVRTTMTGYIVPEAVAEKAFPTEQAEAPAKKAPAKKAAAKKAPAKKAASKPKGEE